MLARANINSFKKKMRNAKHKKILATKKKMNKKMVSYYYCYLN